MEGKKNGEKIKNRFEINKLFSYGFSNSFHVFF